MVIINELRITPEGKSLILDASIENLSYYKNVNIAAVIIDTQETYIPSGPSNRAVYHISYEKESQVVSILDDCSSVKTTDSCECNDIVTAQKYGNKHIRICLTKKDLGVPLDDTLFFVYIVTNGAPAPCTPCGMDNLYTMGIAYNYAPLYNKGMSYIRELSVDCEMPKGFIDYILRFKAFQLSLKTGNYPLAIEYWNKFIKGKLINISKPRRCGCHGNYH